MIENSVKGENWMFRNFYIQQDGVEKDVLENGGLACASFVSSILYLQNSVLEFLKKPKWLEFTHANATSTVRDMMQDGWYEIKDLRDGAVLLWEKQNGHAHIGFYISNDEAISNASNSTGIPTKHHVTYNDTRKIEKIFWHPSLD